MWVSESDNHNRFYINYYVFTIMFFYARYLQFDEHHQSTHTHTRHNHTPTLVFSLLGSSLVRSLLPRVATRKDRDGESDQPHVVRDHQDTQDLTLVFFFFSSSSTLALCQKLFSSLGLLILFWVQLLIHDLGFFFFFFFFLKFSLAVWIGFGVGDSSVLIEEWALFFYEGIVLRICECVCFDRVLSIDGLWWGNWWIWLCFWFILTGLIGFWLNFESVLLNYKKGFLN